MLHIQVSFTRIKEARNNYAWRNRAVEIDGFDWYNQIIFYGKHCAFYRVWLNSKTFKPMSFLDPDHFFVFLTHVKILWTRANHINHVKFPWMHVTQAKIWGPTPPKPKFEDPRHPSQNFDPRHRRQKFIDPRYPCYPRQNSMDACHPRQNSTDPRHPSQNFDPLHRRQNFIDPRYPNYLPDLSKTLLIFISRK